MPTQNKCNCRRKEECPIPENCLATNVIYKAKVTTTDNAETKKYIGMTSNEFKVRYRNHTKSFRDKKHSNETELSKYIWDLKKGRRNFSLKWSILKRATAYQGGAKQERNAFLLCLEEKLFILKAKNENLLNKRSELVSKCRHENKFYLWNTRRTRKKLHLFLSLGCHIKNS